MTSRPIMGWRTNTCIRQLIMPCAMSATTFMRAGWRIFWSLLKRTLDGTYFAAEPFRLFRYPDEQTFRFNNRKDTDCIRFVRILGAIAGKRLTYRELIGETDTVFSSAGNDGDAANACSVDTNLRLYTQCLRSQ